MNTTLGDPKYEENEVVFIIIDSVVTKVKIDMVNQFGITYTFKDLNDEIINQQNGLPLQLPESMVYASEPEAEQALEGILENPIELNSSTNSIFSVGGKRRRRRTIKKRSKNTKKSKKNKKSRRRI